MSQLLLIQSPDFYLSWQELKACYLIFSGAVWGQNRELIQILHEPVNHSRSDPLRDACCAPDLAIDLEQEIVNQSSR